MARNRAMVQAAIWQDEDFTALQVGEQWLYLLLLSQPDVNHLGVLPLLPQRWAQGAPGLSADMIMYDMEALVAARFVVVDEINGAVLIRTLMRHDGVVRQPNVLRAAESCVPGLLSPMIAEALHQELTLIDEHEIPSGCVETLGRIRAQLKGIAAKGSRKGSAKGTENPSGKGSERGSGKGTEEGSENPLGDRGKGLGVREEVAVRARARGTRLPADFVVTQEMVAWCVERCPGLDGRSETEKFRNYWAARTGQGATKLDWVATWRNWMISASERLPSGHIPRQARSTTDERVEAALDVGRRLQERADRGEIGS